MKKLLGMLGWAMLAALFFLPAGAVQSAEAGFSEAELDQMMAPIALYPDSLLAQILMASTYPADVAEAVTWSKQNPSQEGDAAVEGPAVFETLTTAFLESATREEGKYHLHPS